MIEVFKITSDAEAFRESLGDLPLIVLVLLFIVGIGELALRRFDGDLEGKIFHCLILAVAIALWPVMMSGIKWVVDGFNTYLIRVVFDIPWNGLEAVGGVLWDSVAIEEISWDWVFGGLTKLLAVIFEAVRLILYYLFLVFYVFYLVIGPFILARGILAENLLVFKKLLSEVIILFLWQTTFVFLLGIYFFSFAGEVAQTEDPVVYQLAKMILIIVGLVFVPFLTRKFLTEISAPVAGQMMKASALMAGGTALAAAASSVKGGSTVAKYGANKTAPRFFPKLASMAERMGEKLSSTDGEMAPSYSSGNQKAGVDARSNSKRGVSSLQKLSHWMKEAPLRAEAVKNGIEVPTALDSVKRHFSTDPKVQRELLEKREVFEQFRNEQPGLQAFQQSTNASHEDRTPGASRADPMHSPRRAFRTREARETVRSNAFESVKTGQAFDRDILPDKKNTQVFSNEPKVNKDVLERLKKGRDTWELD